jgi:hypothetical protein
MSETRRGGLSFPARSRLWKSSAGPDSIATVFTARDETGELAVVDLDDDSDAPDHHFSAPGGDQ